MAPERDRKEGDVPRNRVILATVFGVVALAAAALLGFLARSGSDVTVLTGQARVGIDQATAVVDGWAYALPVDVAWLGADGSWRLDGRPACLTHLGMSGPIQFGYVPVTGPTAMSWRQVVWVSCKV
jgi:hypothetical protein